jgi:hypothetical protein
VPPLVIPEDFSVSVGDPAQHWQVVSQAHKVLETQTSCRIVPPADSGCVAGNPSIAQRLPSQQKYPQRTATMSGWDHGVNQASVIEGYVHVPEREDIQVTIPETSDEL